MTVFVETNQVNQMNSYKPYAETKTEKKEVKYALLDRIKDAIGDRWFLLKEGTRQNFDMICFLGAERGFVFAGSEYLADRHDISDSTVRKRFAELIRLGLVIKVHRRAKRCNGKGKPIYLFVHHPYFRYWVEFLGLNIEDYHTDYHTENAEIPCESKKETGKKVSTYDLTLKNIIKYNKRKNEPTLNSDFVPSYVPERFILTVQPFFKDAKQIYRLWGKVRLAHKISRLDTPVEDLIHTVIEAFKGSVFTYKQNKVKKAFTGYFFGALRNVFAIEKRRETFNNNPANPIFYNFLEV